MINAIATLFPPIYLVLDEQYSIAGLPLTLIYFLAVSASCGMSVIYASWIEQRL